MMFLHFISYLLARAEDYMIKRIASIFRRASFSFSWLNGCCVFLILKKLGPLSCGESRRRQPTKPHGELFRSSWGEEVQHFNVCEFPHIVCHLDALCLDIRSTCFLTCCGLGCLFASFFVVQRGFLGFLFKASCIVFLHILFAVFFRLEATQRVKTKLNHLGSWKVQVS